MGGHNIPKGISASVAMLALVMAAIAMGISPVFVRLADVGPFTSAFWRVAVALPALWLWVRLDEAGLDAAPIYPSAAVVLGGLAFSGDLLFWHLSITFTTIANATFFATTAPIWVAAFGWVLYRIRVGAHVILGFGLCLIGGMTLAAQSFALDPARITGDVFGLITAVFFGLYFLAIGKARLHVRAARTTFQSSCVTALVLLLVALVMEQKFWPASAQGLLAVAGLGLISHAGGQGLLTIALGRLSAQFSSLVIFLETLAAAIFGWLILGEAVSWLQACGGILILAGIYVARSPHSSKPLRQI